MNIRDLAGALLLGGMTALAGCTDVDVILPQETPGPTGSVPPSATPAPPTATASATATMASPTPTATQATSTPGGDTPTVTPTATPTATSGVPLGQFSCSLAPATSKIDINLAGGGVIPIANVGGMFSNECGTVDAAGIASCTSDVSGFEPIEVPVVGFVCVNPVGGCSPGRVDCDGGAAVTVDLVQDHNIGACDGNPSCETLCGSYCGGLQSQVFDSGCQGYCEEGPNDGASCDFDSDCPDGACNGADPVDPNNICNCQCLDIGGEGSPPGALLLSLGAQIEVEPALPCGDGDATISLPPVCIPMTTETATGVLLQANNEPESQIGPVTRTGAGLDCEALENDDVTGMTLVGAISFFDSSIGDLEIALSWTCE